MNNGVFYSVADSADLSMAMSSYYRYFAAAVTDTNVRWVLYNDFATGTELLSACAPMYDNGATNGLVSVLMGVVCMDMNIIDSVSNLRQHRDWEALYARVVEATDRCTPTWEGMSGSQRYAALEYIRGSAVSEGAETCGSSYTSTASSGYVTDNSSSSATICRTGVHSHGNKEVSGGIIGGVVGGVIALIFVSGGFYYFFMKGSSQVVVASELSMQKMQPNTNVGATAPEVEAHETAYPPSTAIPVASVPVGYVPGAF